MVEEAEAGERAAVEEGAARDQGGAPLPVQQRLVEAEDAVQEDDDLEDQEDGAQDAGGL